MMRIQAVVFDLDDTLFPEREYAFSGFRTVATAFAAELDNPEETLADLRRLFDSQHRPRVFDALLMERFGKADHALVARMICVFREHPPAIVPYADVDSALTRLRERCKLGLITDGRASAQWAKIDALRLKPRFDCIIVTDDLRPDAKFMPPSGAAPGSYAKPHPLAFEEIARQLGTPPGACAYVADNVTKDFVAPNSLGWLSVKIMRPDAVYGDAVCAENGAPKHTIKTLDELDAILDDAQ